MGIGEMGVGEKGVGEKGPNLYSVIEPFFLFSCCMY